MRAFAREHDRFHRVSIAGAPAAAWDPVWCSWYGIKGNVDAAYILGMAPLLKDWGFGSIIVDDGWFVRDHFDEETGHYAADEGKFPDMDGLARQVQEAGLRILLWCAPVFRLGEIAREPFVAEHLFHPQGQEHPEQFLCPRSPGGARLCGPHGRAPDAHLPGRRPQDRLHRSPDGARGPALPGGAPTRHRGVW